MAGSAATGSRANHEFSVKDVIGYLPVVLPQPCQSLPLAKQFLLQMRRMALSAQAPQDYSFHLETDRRKPRALPGGALLYFQITFSEPRRFTACPQLKQRCRKQLMESPPRAPN